MVLGRPFEYLVLIMTTCGGLFAIAHLLDLRRDGQDEQPLLEAHLESNERCLRVLEAPLPRRLYDAVAVGF